MTQEFGRTAFGVWVQLQPGRQTRTVFTYRLPFTVQELSEQALEDTMGTNTSAGAAYTLYLTSQSGKTDRAHKLRIDYPPSWNVRWSNRADVHQSTGHVNWSGMLSEDQIFAFSFAPSSYEQKSFSQEP